MISTIIRKELKVLLKEKGTFFWLIGLPIMFIVLFSSIFNNAKDTFTIQYYDADQSQQSQQMIAQLSEIKGFEMKTDTTLSLDDQLDKIKSGKMTSLLVFPKGFGENMQAGGGRQAAFDLYRDSTADTAVAPIRALLDSFAGKSGEVKLQGVLKSVGMNDTQVKEAMQPPIVINEVKENAAQVSALTQYIPGYTVMFVFFIIITMVRNFIKDRESGMVARLRSTPMKPVTYLIGMWVPNIIVVLVQCTVLLGFGKLVYGVELGDIASIAAVVLCLAICATGIGLMLTMLVKSENQGLGFTQILTMGGAVLGGLWFPYDFMPDFMQIIGKITPQYWAQHSFQDIMVRGAQLTDILPTIAVLIGYGLLGLAIASLRFKKFIQTATQG
ncbi:ABC transporter permease [Paenibacillus contaminans]|uniref:ABC transporter permease n=1 Tax=Paenibacillus contaminans TaxID=450362 RepID=A0A329MKQ3_9BACL|nr:ABC transporter permease [Paenibacillus contaminans]RAV20385.1 ABC transporter permease [Paenibacillus contaminans]